ncbi:hypothetical protein FA95DRAFT_1573022 [Auriscalpium vulgare]|uniref:Uncharacterized protein n=1 Tax=Auriscalpium vulgare TaxID=40419 RepID=A0ACB8RS52_9AGAM|nr:hypothetical protein FA95DRAFT_1573022 [Auriscalpium vulgare]
MAIVPDRMEGDALHTLCLCSVGISGAGEYAIGCTPSQRGRRRSSSALSSAKSEASARKASRDSSPGEEENAVDVHHNPATSFATTFVDVQSDGDLCTALTDASLSRPYAYPNQHPVVTPGPTTQKHCRHNSLSSGDGLDGRSFSNGQRARGRSPLVKRQGRHVKESPSDALRGIYASPLNSGKAAGTLTELLVLTSSVQ